MRRNHPKTRRGVVLIVVLGLLALFGLVMVTFLMTTEQQQMGSESRSVIERFDDAPRTHLRGAIEQLLVGTRRPTSVAQVHSLLEDVYGPPSVPSTNPNARVSGLRELALDAVTNRGSVIQIDINWPNVNDGYLEGFALAPGYYDGQILTFTSGKCAGKSTRILKYTRIPQFPAALTTTGSRMVLAPFDGMYDVVVNDRFMVNGRPFNGLGVGLDPKTYATNGLLDWTNDPARVPLDEFGQRYWEPADNMSPQFVPPLLRDLPIALLPNPTTQAYQNYLAASETYFTDLLPDHNLPSAPPAYSANEDYDAADFQNMLLAFTYYRENQGPLTLEPSLHRPQLMLYWARQAEGSDIQANQLVNRVNEMWRAPAYSPTGEISADLKRAVSLRPIAEDHPEFAFVNPQYEEFPFGRDTDNDGIADVYFWDVDNDGDGEVDSVWVDLGMPVATDSEGRRYKPMFAILVRDQDGKLNLNAHGVINGFVGPNLEGVASGTRGQMATVESNNGNNIKTAGVGSSGGLVSGTARVHAGQGVSVASVSLHEALGDREAGDLTGLAKIKQGRVDGSVRVPGVYGESTTAGTNTPVPGVSGGDINTPAPPVQTASGLLHGELPFGNVGIVARYGSGADFNENGGYVVDAAGRPHYDSNYHGQTTEADNDPWEVNLFRDLAYDNAGTVEPIDAPFGPRDLYWLLNPLARELALGSFHGANPDGFSSPSGGTLDAGTSRLRWLLRNGVQTSLHRRNLFTTHSFDIPAPPFVATPEIARGLAALDGTGANAPPITPRANLTFLDMVRGKIKQVDSSITEAEIAELLFETEIGGMSGDRYAIAMPEYNANNPNQPGAELIAPELLAGLRINLNRPLGDGYTIDYDGDGQNDAIGKLVEMAVNKLDDGNAPDPQNWPTLWNGTAKLDLYPDGLTQGGSADANSWIRDGLTKQRLAKQLYFLMMVLKDHNYAETTPTTDASEDKSEPNRRELTSNRIAQWAVNVVDYIDRDGIMTAFEYDANPFNGWHVDGLVDSEEDHPDRRVVWGMENAYLVLTETSAFHDLKVKDKNDAPSKSTVPEDDDDEDFDEDTDQVRPPQGSAFIELLCVADPHNPLKPSELFTNNQLDLGKMSLNNTGKYPVWRVAVSEAHLGHLQGTMPGTNLNPVPAAQRWPYEIHGPDGEPTAATEPLFHRHPDSAIPQPIPYTPTSGTVSTNAQPPGWKTGTILPQEYTAMGPHMTDSKRIERIVWMTPNRPADDVVDRDRIYYKGTTTRQPLLSPGQYAVIGPHRGNVGGDNGLVTRIGHSENTVNSQEISLIGDTVQVSDWGLSPTDTEPYTFGSDHYNQAPLGIPCRWVADFAGSSGSLDLGLIPFSITEPVPTLTGSNTYTSSTYYDPVITGNWEDATHQTPTVAGQTTTDMYPAMEGDRPLDFRDSFPLVAEGIIPKVKIKRPRKAMEFTVDTYAPYPGHFPHYKTVYLQRLADPTREWNEVSNPYITVDWLPIDLTVFTGEADQMHQEQSILVTSADNAGPYDDTNASQIDNFATRERGTVDPNALENHPDINFFAHGSIDPVESRSNPGNTAGQKPANMSEAFAHSLGFLNSTWHTADGEGHEPAEPYYTVDNPYNDPMLKGFPDSGRFHPWLQWPDSPVKSPMELMLVPASSPQRLSMDFSTFNPSEQTGEIAHKLYAERLQGQGEPLHRHETPFGHLLNFTLTGQAGSAPGAITNNPENQRTAAISNYYRIFDYVGVPTPFSGAEEMLPPSTFDADAFTATDRQHLTGLSAPYNYVSKYREPGRINLNTGADTSNDTWLGATNHFGDRNGDGNDDNIGQITGSDFEPLKVGQYTASWAEVRQSRLGFPEDSVGTRSQSVPSLFAQPFRGHSTGFPVPVAALRQEMNDTGVPSGSRWMVDSGLLRRLRSPIEVTSASPSIPRNRAIDEPLFRFLSYSDPRTEAANDRNATTTAPVYLNQFNDSFRNPAFRFSLLERMSNVATTRSNVHAVWVTVGYFEVAPVTEALNQRPNGAGTYGAGMPSPRYPDGYMLGQELGAEDGNIRRHKAFFIVDRSIPVAFERGQMHNADKTIIYEQYFEQQ
jgi:hypothetical protein